MRSIWWGYAKECGHSDGTRAAKGWEVRFTVDKGKQSPIVQPEKNVCWRSFQTAVLYASNSPLYKDISKEGTRDIELEEKLGGFLGVVWPGVSWSGHVVCEGEFPLPGHLMMSGDSRGCSEFQVEKERWYWHLVGEAQDFWQTSCKGQNSPQHNRATSTPKGQECQGWEPASPNLPYCQWDRWIAKAMGLGLRRWRMEELGGRQPAVFLSNCHDVPRTRWPAFQFCTALISSLRSKAVSCPPGPQSTFPAPVSSKENSIACLYEHTLVPTHFGPGRSLLGD